MKTVEKNDTVTLAFIGKLDNGELFMSMDKDSPFTVTIGASDLPPTVESALINMTVGQSRKVRVAPEEGYGPRQKDLLQTITNMEVIEKLKAKPGLIVYMNVEKDGQQHKVPATVMEVEEDRMVVDYNHPLAGHHLNYEITILDIEKGVA